MKKFIVTSLTLLALVLLCTAQNVGISTTTPTAQLQADIEMLKAALVRKR